MTCVLPTESRKWTELDHQGGVGRKMKKENPRPKKTLSTKVVHTVANAAEEATHKATNIVLDVAEETVKAIFSPLWK